VCTHAAYDFKRNCVRRETRFATEYKASLDWFGVDGAQLEPETHVERVEYDAGYLATAVDGSDHSDIPPLRNLAIRPSKSQVPDDDERQRS
jgi:hypothetical protein